MRDRVDAVTSIDDAAVSGLFDEALPIVHGYLRRRCGSHDLAEDLTATTFVRAAIAWSDGQVERCTVPWLITVARNLLTDHWRHQAVVERTAAMHHDPAGVTADPWNAVLDASVAETALGRLKAEHRAVLTLRYVDDLPVGEVAIAMGRSVHATESLLSRARASLRHAYEATSDVPSGDAAPTSPEDAR